MIDKVKKKVLTPNQLGVLAGRTCAWWNAVFIQKDRFFDVLEDDHGGDPWDVENGAKCSFPAERLFLIIAIYHAVDELEKVDIELNRMGDASLQPVFDAITKVASLKDIEYLRNMNEHELDYIAEVGMFPEEYKSTAARWTIVIGDKGIFRVGKINIVDLLQAMEKQLPFVRAKTKEIFDKNY